MTKVLAFRKFVKAPKIVLHIYHFTSLMDMCELLQRYESHYHWWAREFLRNTDYLDDHGNLNIRMVMCIIHLTVSEVTDQVMLTYEPFLTGRTDFSALDRRMWMFTKRASVLTTCNMTRRPHSTEE